MQIIQYTKRVFFFLILCQFSVASFGQVGISFDIKKPKEYDERVLRSEKSDQKKFTLPRRLVQNAVTHYNYVFNANNKLNEVLERAKASFIDDYSLLLPFYNYTLDATAQDSIKLDSITYKASTGIALHDLRNDWVDNLYLLWGAAFYLHKEFDSAFLMFQFINYAFAEKEKDGYYKMIGSSMDGNSAFSIATKEKRSLPRKIFTQPPSRNDAFIWQIRNFLAQDQFTEAASLIVTLRTDPNFPRRLQNDLDEVQAYWFYKQSMWDSSVVHLVKALDNAPTLHEKARWEYLIAQLYEMTGNYKESERYFTKVATHTTDPVMDVYARLFAVRVNKDGGEKNIEKNIAELVKMAKRDKYHDYRDIIYYMAAQMQLERNDVDGALALLLKSTQYTSNDPSLRNKAFLQLAEISFIKRQYRQAYNFYDSLRLDDPSLKNVEALTAKKGLLGNVANQIEVVERQDSLQHLASLPEEERNDIVRKMVKQLRKQQGLKDEGVNPVISPFAIQTANPFSTPDKKGEWYFYNTASRARGQNDFKAKWGNRSNQDNWRRVAGSGIQTNFNKDITGRDGKPSEGNSGNPPAEITFETLSDNIPLTPKKLQESNDSIQAALFTLGKLYIQEIEDCTVGIETLEQLRSRFPQFEKMDEVLFNLYYCHNKNGETAQAAEIKKLMSEKFPASNFTTIVTTGKNPQSTQASPEATGVYEKIYDLFIEGNFEQAKAQKKEADSIYGNNYWTPQLLYIESVYYIKQRDDSTAKKILNDIINKFPGTPLAAKATTLADVLSRRAKIEEELRNLVIVRPKEDTVINRPVNNPVVINNNLPAKDTATRKPQQPVVVNNNLPVKDTLNKKNLGASFTFVAEAPYYVVLILDKVDPVFSNEAKNAFFRYNREAFSNKIMAADLIELDGNNRLLLISPFKDAQEAADYVEKTRPKTATEIIPWLKGGKYTYSIITEKNLELLKANKDLETYKSFLNRYLPGKF
jgi:outer membrane protein assembly factor BamD (BamD/ComL family)